ncbi:unnamed protein product, partial [marine sediment metagenome]
LCYVGVTRAKQKVYLVRAFRRSLMGRSLVSEPSRFLSDIPQHLISSSGWWQGEERRVAEAIYSWNRAPTPSPATSELKAGDHVHHAQFGNGVVVSCQAVKDDAEVVIAFNGAIKKLLLSFAQLEKVE